jgi:hypothetical protein
MKKNSKTVDGFKKIHHGNLGEKPSKHLNREELGDEVVNDFDFERYCVNCDNFRDPERCPFYPTTEDTLWKEELDCKYFWD